MQARSNAARDIIAATAGESHTREREARHWVLSDGAPRPQINTSAFETIIASSSLDVVIPNPSFGFPSREIDRAEWLVNLRRSEELSILVNCPFSMRGLASPEPREIERMIADKQLQLRTCLHLGHHEEVEPVDPASPSPVCLSFLAHTQISFDSACSFPCATRAARLKVPPCASGGIRSCGHLPPSNILPAALNPMPATAEHDQRYMRSEGLPPSVFTPHSAHVAPRRYRLRPNRSRLSLARSRPLAHSVRVISCEDASATRKLRLRQSSPSIQDSKRLAPSLTFRASLVSGRYTPVLPSTRLGLKTRRAEFVLRPARNAKEQKMQSPTPTPPTV
jgi:hypothetical protein